MKDQKPVKIGELLLGAGLIDRLQLGTALKYQKEWNRKLGESLVELGFISEAVLVKVLSKFLKVPLVELSQTRVNPVALQRIPKRLADKYEVFPVDLEGKEPALKLLVAMADPTNLNAIDEIAFTAGCRIKPLVASHSEIQNAIRRHYGDERVVDIFFSLSGESSGPEAKSPDGHGGAQFNEDFSAAIEDSIKSLQMGDEADGPMVIFRGGEETVLHLGEEDEAVSVPAPLAAKPAPIAYKPNNIPEPSLEHFAAPAFEKHNTPDPFMPFEADPDEADPEEADIVQSSDSAAANLSSFDPSEDPEPEFPSAFGGGSLESDLAAEFRQPSRLNDAVPAPLFSAPEVTHPENPPSEELQLEAIEEEPLPPILGASRNWRELPPAQMLQVLLSLLIKKGLINEADVQEVTNSLERLDAIRDKHDS